MKKTILILFLFTIVNCKDPVENKCESACQFFVKCTEEINKIKISGELLNNTTIQCMDGCTRFQSEILSCYAEENDSCSGMVECMLQSGLGD